MYPLPACSFFVPLVFAEFMQPHQALASFFNQDNSSKVVMHKLIVQMKTCFVQKAKYIFSNMSEQQVVLEKHLNSEQNLSLLCLSVFLPFKQFLPMPSNCQEPPRLK